MVKKTIQRSTIALTVLVLSGCAIDVDLNSSPSVVKVGESVTFDVAIRNRTTCPVGGVVALLVPFIPRDFFISQIPDPDLRAALSAFADAFCSGADVQPPGGAGSCRIENGELVCDIVPAMTLPGPLPDTAFAATEAGDAVVCSSDGVKITCRFPHALVEQAMAQAATSETSLGGLQCVAGNAFAICAAALLDPSETKTAQVQIAVPRPGILHNWIISFPTVRGGVCTGGVIPRRPCADDSDCTGMGNTCGTGICTGGMRDGFGCNTGTDCPGGSCTTCEVPDDGQLLSGVACTTTASSANAMPAASSRGLLAMIATLGLAGGFAIRRVRSR